MGTWDTLIDWGRSYRKDQLSAKSFIQRHPSKICFKSLCLQYGASLCTGSKPVAGGCRAGQSFFSTWNLQRCHWTQINLLPTPTRKGKGPFCYFWTIPWGKEETGDMSSWSYAHTRTYLCFFTPRKYWLPVPYEGRWHVHFISRLFLTNSLL